MLGKFVNSLKFTNFNPCHSLDLASCDFQLFLMFKEKLCGRKFNTDSKVTPATQGSLKKLLEKIFSICFEKWVERWNRFVTSKGKYIEKE